MTTAPTSGRESGLVASRRAILQFPGAGGVQASALGGAGVRSWLESGPEAKSYHGNLLNRVLPGREFVAGAWLSANEVPEAAQYEERELALNEFFLDLCQRRGFQPTKAASVYVAPFLDDWRLCLTIYWTSDWKRYPTPALWQRRFLNEHNLPSPKGIVQSTAGVLLVQSAADALGEQVAFPEPFVAILTGAPRCSPSIRWCASPLDSRRRGRAREEIFSRVATPHSRDSSDIHSPQEAACQERSGRNVLWLYRESVEAKSGARSPKRPIATLPRCGTR
jgi:hypothetical protein